MKGTLRQIIGISPVAVGTVHSMGLHITNGNSKIPGVPNDLRIIAHQ